MFQKSITESPSEITGSSFTCHSSVIWVIKFKMLWIWALTFCFNLASSFTDFHRLTTVHIKRNCSAVHSLVKMTWTRFSENRLANYNSVTKQFQNRPRMVNFLSNEGQKKNPYFSENLDSCTSTGRKNQFKMM